MRPALSLLLAGAAALAQTSLQQKIQAIAAGAQGGVSVACSLPDTALNCDLNPRAHPPMQSVFKLPLAIAALHLVERGKFALDQPIRFRADDRILPHAYSPLQDKYPEAEVDIPLRELLRLAVSLSDNVAADIVLRLAGGPAAVDGYIRSRGVEGFQLRDGEHELHRDEAAQYRNWFEPRGAVELLRIIAERSPLNAAHTRLLLDWMTASGPGARRIKGELPPDTVVMHKPGTSGTRNGVAGATNDIGLIVLPDGRRLAMAVFVTDSRADDAAREAVIARIAKAVYEEAVRLKVY